MTNKNSYAFKEDSLKVIEAARKNGRTVMNENQYSEILDRVIGRYYFPDKHTIEVTFQVTEACTLACKYCVTGDTLITMGDRTLKPISEVEIGDEVLCFDEKSLPGQNKKLRVGKVEQLFKHALDQEEKLYKVTLSDGSVITITGNHKVLTDHGRFREVDRLNVGDSVRVYPTTTYNLEDTDDYQLGYLIGMWYGDGTYNKFKRDYCNSYQYKVRLALKDMEPIYYLDKVMDKFGLEHYLKPFNVSEKFNLHNDAIFSNRRDTQEKLVSLIETNLGKNDSKEYLRGFLAGIYDAEGHIDAQNHIRIANTELIVIEEIERALKAWNFAFTRELHPAEAAKDNPCYTVRLGSEPGYSYLPVAIRFCDCVQPKIERKLVNVLGHQYINSVTIVSKELLDTKVDVYNIGTDKHTYIANNVLVHNCYQYEKTPARMTWEVAKKGVDRLFEDYKDTHYAVVLDFIGGEPFLEPELIGKIVDYWEYQLIMHMDDVPWYLYYMYSICSNGTDYFKPEVQKLLNRLTGKLSFTVSIDGNKELHDSARVHHDGVTGSYDEAIAAANDAENNRFGYDLGSKMTIAPSNLMHLVPALKHYMDSGRQIIFANTVYEEGWTVEHAKFYYNELKRLADYKLENYPEIHVSLFDDRQFMPASPEDNQPYCGGRGKMLVIAPDGTFYPCLRYTPTSVGHDREYYITCGNVDDGLDNTVIDELATYTRDIIEDSECYNCPIHQGCGECFPAGTLIDTPNGHKAIETLQVGDVVYDKDGKIQPVVDTIQLTSSDLTSIRAVGFPELITTKAHPFWTKHADGTIGWTNAGDLVCTDKIAMLAGDAGEVDIPKELAYLAGRYLGDGYKSKSGRLKTPFRYGITCGADEFDELKAHFDATSVGYYARKLRNAYDFKFHTSDTADAKLLYRIVEQQGRHADTKHVAPEVFSWNEASIKAYLQGYFDADGCLDDDCQRFASVSHALVLDIAKLVRMVYKRQVNITVQHRHDNNIIEGRLVNAKTCYEGRFLLDEHKRNQWEYSDGIIWCNLKKSTKVLPEELPVYNLTIGNTHSFIANGAIVHNCAAYSWQMTNRSDVRVKYQCIMHKARALANVYYWNKYYAANEPGRVMLNNCPKEWALEIIDEDEWNMLNQLVLDNIETIREIQEASL